MDEMLAENVKLIFTLDCGTTAFNIIDNKKYSSMIQLLLIIISVNLFVLMFFL